MMTDIRALSKRLVITPRKRLQSALLLLVLFFCNTHSSIAQPSEANDEHASGVWSELSELDTDTAIGIAIVFMVLFGFPTLWKLITNPRSASWSDSSKALVVFVATLAAALQHVALGHVFGHETLGIVVAIGIIELSHHLYDRLTSIPDLVLEAIPGALDSKRVLVTGTLHSTKLKEMVQVIDSQTKLDGCQNGIGIFLFRAEPGDYVDICMHFLKSAKYSIEGMSDMELDKALPLFAGDGAVVKWVEDVNKIAKARNSKIHSHRILVLTEERRLFLQALEQLKTSDDLDTLSNARNVIRDYSRISSLFMGNGNGEDHLDAFIESAKSGFDKFYNDYCLGTSPVHKNMAFNILVRTSDEIGGKYNFRDGLPQYWRNQDNLPRGEFIIFDRKYLVRFDSDAKLLEVFIGELVGEFAKVFDRKGLLNFPVNTTFTEFDSGLQPYQPINQAS